MKLKLLRNPSADGATIGKLFVEGVFECFTLEDQIREVPGQAVEQWKVAGQTAIPSGTYRVTVDFSMRFQRMMLHVLNVPGFDGIRIHSGNTAADTEGCILVGMGVDHNAAQPDITESRVALKGLFDRVWNVVRYSEPVYIEIINTPSAPEPTKEV